MWIDIVILLCFYLLALISPNDDTEIIEKNTINYGVYAGVYAAAGVSCGIILPVLYSILGVGYVFYQYHWLQSSMKLLAALYLGYLGVQGFTKRSNVLDADFADTEVFAERFQPFLAGFITNGLNPKATLFLSALFITFATTLETLVIRLSVGGLFVLISLAWFASLAHGLTESRWRERYRHYAPWVSFIFSTALCCFACYQVGELLLDLIFHKG